MSETKKPKANILQQHLAHSPMKSVKKTTGAIRL